MLYNWDPTAESVSKFITNQESMHRQLEDGGKPQSDSDKTLRLAKALQQADIADVNSITLNARTNDPHDPDFPKYRELRSKLLALELSNPAINQVVKGGKRKRTNESNGKKDSSEKEDDFDPKASKKSLQNTLKVLSAKVEELEKNKRNINDNQHDRGGRGGRGRGGGRDGRGGAGRGGRDGRGRGGRGRGSEGGQHKMKKAFYCWSCGSSDHYMSQCKEPETCRVCKGQHLTSCHDIATTFPGNNNRNQGSAKLITSDALGSAYTEEDANNDFGGYNSTGYSTDMVHGDWTGESDPEADSDSDESEVNNEGGEEHSEAHSSDYEQELDEVLTREFEDEEAQAPASDHTLPTMPTIEERRVYVNPVIERELEVAVRDGVANARRAPLHLDAAGSRPLVSIGVMRERITSEGLPRMTATSLYIHDVSQWNYDTSRLRAEPCGLIWMQEVFPNNYFKPEPITVRSARSPLTGYSNPNVYRDLFLRQAMPPIGRGMETQLRYEMMNNWLRWYWRTTDVSIVWDLPHPDSVPEIYNDMLTTFLAQHYMDGRSAPSGGASVSDMKHRFRHAMFDYYMRSPIHADLKDCNSTHPTPLQRLPYEYGNSAVIGARYCMPYNKYKTWDEDAYPEYRITEQTRSGYEGSGIIWNRTCEEEVKENPTVFDEAIENKSIYMLPLPRAQNDDTAPNIQGLRADDLVEVGFWDGTTLRAPRLPIEVYGVEEWPETLRHKYGTVDNPVQAFRELNPTKAIEYNESLGPDQGREPAFENYLQSTRRHQRSTVIYQESRESQILRAYLSKKKRYERYHDKTEEILKLKREIKFLKKKAHPYVHFDAEPDYVFGKRRRDEDDEDGPSGARDPIADGGYAQWLAQQNSTTGTAGTGAVNVIHGQGAGEGAQTLAVKHNSDQPLVLLDSGSSFHVQPTLDKNKKYFRENKGQVSMTVANGQGMTVTHIGRVPGHGRTVVSPQTTDHIASLGQLQLEGYTIYFDQDMCRGKTVNGQPAVAVLKHKGRNISVYCYLTHTGHYMMTRAAFYSMIINDNNNISNNSEGNGTAMAITTSADGNPIFTPEQVERAHKVRHFHIVLGHPSDATLTRAFNNGLVIGTELTATDVSNAHLILGDCTGCLAGKRIKPSYYSKKDEPAAVVGQVLHADIFILTPEDGKLTYGGSDVMLFVVDEFSGYLTIKNMKDKSKNELIRAFNLIISEYRAYGHEILKIKSDSENNLKSCKPHLNNNGIKYKATPPYQHAQRVERYVRSIKQRMACMKVTSPIKLSGQVEGELAKAAVNYFNNFPTSKHPTLTPRILMEGEKFQLDDRDRLIPFGTVAHIDFPHEKTPRTNLAVVLGPSSYTDHAHDCYVLDTATVVIRASREIKILEKIPKDFQWPVQADAENKPAGLDPFKMKHKKRVTKERPLPEQIRQIGKDSISKDIGVKRPAQSALPEEPPTKRNSETPRDYINSAREGEFEDDDEPDEQDQQQGSPTDLDDEDEYLGNEITEAEDAKKAADKKLRAEIKRKEHFNQTMATLKRLEREAAEEKARKEVEQALKEHVANPQKGQPRYNFRRLSRNEARLLCTRGWEHTDCRLKMIVAAVMRISVKEALSGEHAQESKEAIIEEILNMLTYKVGHYVKYCDIPVNKRKNILRSFMFLKHKTTPDGIYERSKARLVGNGAHQKEHMYNLVSSSTVGLASVFLMFNLATMHRCKLTSYDVKGAFLHAEFGPDDEVTYIKINKEVAELWIEQDPSAAEFVDDRGELILELDRFIYGLKQSPLKFQIHLTNVLTSLGYKKTAHDECMFVKHKGKHFSILTVHVDDILQISTSETLYDELKRGLTEAYGTITTHDEAAAYLGMTIERSTCKSYVKITQGGLIQKLIEMHPREAVDRKRYNTPAEEEIFDEHVSARARSLDDKERSLYLGLIMTLMYLARLSRPDILLPVTFLASKTHVATEKDREHALRIVRYLENFKEEGMILHCSDLKIEIHCDASHLVHKAAGKGHTGFYVTLGNSRSYVHGRSGKQKYVATSSTEAEVIAALDAVKFAVWLRNLLVELQITPLAEMTLLQDNKSAMMLQENPSNKRTAHLTSKLRYVQEQIQLGKLRSEHVPTKELAADLMTKPLQGSHYTEHSETILGSRWSKFLSKR